MCWIIGGSNPGRGKIFIFSLKLAPILWPIKPPNKSDLMSATKVLLDFHEILWVLYKMSWGAKILFEKFGQSYWTEELKCFPPYFPYFLADIFGIRRQETSTQINPFGLNAAFVKIDAMKPCFRCEREGICKRPVDICLPTWKKFDKRIINPYLANVENRVSS